MHPTFDLVIPVFGTLQIAFTEADHAHVSGDITVRGIQYHVGVHIFAHPLEHSDSLAPTFRVGRAGDSPYQVFQHLHVTRRNEWGKPVSDAARKTIREQVELAANNFIVNNRSVLVLAEREKLQQEMESAEHDYAEAMEKADKALAIRNEKQEAFRLFMGGKS